jgi:hypothetical protein
MGKKEKKARQAKAERGNYSKLINKVRKKGKNRGKLPQSLKSRGKLRAERHGFDLTGMARPELERLGEEELRQMSFVRGQGKVGNKNRLIDVLLGFKLKIQKREVREGLYAQYLARCAKEYADSEFSARGDVLTAIRSLGGKKGGAGQGTLTRLQKVPGGGGRMHVVAGVPNPR